MPKKIPNIKFSKSNKNPEIDSDTSLYTLPLYKDVDYFSNLDNFVSYIKAVERMVRSSKFYKRYVSYIKNDIGLNSCQVLSNITVEEDDCTKLEMHHGPILTLFDYIAIMLDYMLYHNMKITTFTLANKILQEHFDNHIQVVMLSVTAHEETHVGDLFLNINQAFGDLNAFLYKYRDGINDEQINKINKYIEFCETHDSFDKNTFQIKELKKWV